MEIIGNSKNVSRLQKHFKKMFAGVTSIILDEEKGLITGICSKEGEEVTFFLFNSTGVVKESNVLVLKGEGLFRLRVVCIRCVSSRTTFIKSRNDERRFSC